MAKSRKRVPWLTLTAIAMASRATAAPSQEELRRKDMTEYVAELQKVAPDRVEAFERASRDYYADRYAQALEGFEAVYRAAPSFLPALRRMCHCERLLGRRGRAIELCRKAAETENADSLASLALALAYPGAPSSAAEQQEASRLAQRAVELEPESPWSNLAQCTVGVATHDGPVMHRCLPKLREIAPREMAASMYLGFAESLLDGPPRTDLDARGEATHALETAKTLGADPVAVAKVACHWAFTYSETKTLENCSNTLLELAPKDPQSHFIASLTRATSGDFSKARKELNEAEHLGMPPAQVAALRTSIDNAEPFYKRWLRHAGWTLGLWFGGFALLTLLGMVLSKVALAAARDVPKESSGRAAGMTSGLRSLYRIVLWLTCIYYYLSMPLVILSVFAIGGGLIYFFFAIGHIPVKLVLIIGLLVFATFGAIIKSLFVRPVEEDPGKRLDLAQHPKLCAVLEEVASRVGTSPVDSVFLTPGTEIAVFERGKLLAQLRHKTERCLILGAGVIQGMGVLEFKSILAHEYGHFCNRDTAGGGFALAVRRSLVTMARGLAMAGAAAPYNPAWIFIVNFHKLFLRVSHGASRLQEVLADRWAAFAYGSKNFVNGFTHVIRASVAFEAHVQSVLTEVIEGNRPLKNLYSHAPATAPDPTDIDEAFNTAMSAEPSPFDSHPSPKERISSVQSLDARGPESDGGAGEVWDLFESREYLESEMTAQVRQNVQLDHGVQIAAG
jgi:Zn-dependent protease with chaperone function